VAAQIQRFICGITFRRQAVGISTIGKLNNSIGITFKAHLGAVSGDSKTPLSCHHHFPTLYATPPAIFRGGNVVTSLRFRLMNNLS
jgi:hypothetical protein